MRHVPVDLVWTPQAREDLIEIYTYIGLDNPSAADRVFDALQSKAGLLIAHRRKTIRYPSVDANPH
jgi:toxin ParE1/3/4